MRPDQQSNTTPNANPSPVSAHPSAPALFAADERTLFYPAAAGRVYSITFAALADCRGNAEDFADSTERGDLGDMLYTQVAPFTLGGGGWVPAAFDGGRTGNGLTGDDLIDLVHEWADWCDRDEADDEDTFAVSA